MRRITAATAMAFLCSYAYSQEPADALRFSWINPGATARVKAIGGANASLGGDISSTFINPAGLAFYRTGDFVITPGYKFENIKSNYRGTDNRSTGSNGQLGTTGVVIGGNGSRTVRNFAVSFAFNRTADFNQNITYIGQNNQSSFSQQYVEELNNNRVTNPAQAEYGYPLGASLLYNTHWIDSISDGAGRITRFRTNAPVSTGLAQQNTVKTSGGVTEFALGFAGNFKNKLMLGGSLGVPILNYKKNREFVEADITSNSANAFDYGIFKDYLHTSGIGINLKAGLIYKAAEYWRLGFAFHTPTFYSLTDNYEASVLLNDDVPDDQAWQDNSKSYMSGNPSEFRYYLVTPLRLMGSVSYVLREIEDVTKQKGFLTADVEYVNYGSSSYQPNEENNNDQGTKNYLNSLSGAISNAYKSAFNVRVGGELKFTTVMVRAGVAYLGNPYVNLAGEKGSKLNLSGGLGYRNRGFFVDLTYVHNIQKDVHFPYRLQYSPYSGAALRNTGGNALLTLGFKI